VKRATHIGKKEYGGLRKRAEDYTAPSQGESVRAHTPKGQRVIKGDKKGLSAERREIS